MCLFPISYIEEDFSTHPIEVTIPDQAAHSGRYEFVVNITLNDDSVQEPTEYFLLVLGSPGKVAMVDDADRQCSGVKITEDHDGKKRVN